MPAPPKPTDGNLRTFGSPPSRGDVNDKSLPLNLNTGSLIGIGTMGAGLAGAAGLGIRRRNDALAAKGALSISNIVADQWLNKYGQDRFGNRPQIQWVVQDLFHPDPEVRAEAAKHIETIDGTNQEKFILKNAVWAGEEWNNPPNNPELQRAHNDVHTKTTAQAVLQGQAKQQQWTTDAGQSRQNKSSLSRWARDVKRGSTAPMPPESTWQAAPPSTSTEPELISKSERGRQIQAGRANNFSMPQAARSAWAQQTAQAFEQSPFARAMEGIYRPIDSGLKTVNSWTDRLVPAPLRGTKIGGAAKGVAGLGLGYGMQKLGEAAFSNVGKKEAASVKAADTAAGKGLGPAPDTPGGKAAQQKALTNDNVTKAIATLNDQDEITPWHIETVEKQYGLKPGTLDAYLKKQ